MPKNVPQLTPEQVTGWQLNASLWYVSHKTKLKKILLGFLIGLNVILFGYCLYFLGLIFFVQDPAMKADMANVASNQIDYNYFRQTQAPQNIQILGFNVVGGKDGKYDFIVKVKNTNSNFLAQKVYYQVLASNQILAEKTGYIYPNEEKYFGIFGVKANSAANAMLNIAKVDWQRTKDFNSVWNEHYRFKITDIKFTPAGDSGVKGNLPVSILNYKITNDSAYSYWHVGVYMVLLSGGVPVGANFMSLDQLKSGEAREIEMRWYESLPGISNVEIIPEVDILDLNAIMPVK